MQLPEKIIQNERTVAIFLYLLNNREPSGVRAVQKEMGVSNPSTIYWHLQKLVEEGVVEKTPSNLYQVTEEYRKVSKIKLPLAVTHYVIGKYVVPNLLVQVVFLAINAVVILLAILATNFAFAALVGFSSVIVELILLLNFFGKSSRSKAS